MKKVIGILILCLLKLLLMVDAFQFDLPARDFKCFREELVDNFDVYGEYDVGPGHSQKIDFRVIDSKGDLLVDRRNVKSGDFSFKTKEGGEHSFCFFNRLSAGMVLVFLFGHSNKGVKMISSFPLCVSVCILY